MQILILKKKIQTNDFHCILHDHLFSFYQQSNRNSLLTFEF